MAFSFGLLCVSEQSVTLPLVFCQNETIKSAKLALCTSRIAKAILVGIPLLYEHFPIP